MPGSPDPAQRTVVFFSGAFLIFLFCRTRGNKAGREVRRSPCSLSKIDVSNTGMKNAADRRPQLAGPFWSRMKANRANRMHWPTKSLKRPHCRSDDSVQLRKASPVPKAGQEPTTNNNQRKNSRRKKITRRVQKSKQFFTLRTWLPDKCECRPLRGMVQAGRSQSSSRMNSRNEPQENC